MLKSRSAMSPTEIEELILVHRNSSSRASIELLEDSMKVDYKYIFTKATESKDEYENLSRKRRCLVNFCLAFVTSSIVRGRSCSGRRGTARLHFCWKRFNCRPSGFHDQRVSHLHDVRWGNPDLGLVQA